MKKIMGLFVAMLLVLSLPLALAEEETEDAGVTPDSPLYGLDRAMDRIALALTFNKAAKAEKGLNIAQERLMEAKEMADESKNIQDLAASSKRVGKAYWEKENIKKAKKFLKESIRYYNKLDDTDEVKDLKKEFQM